MVAASSGITDKILVAMMREIAAPAATAHNWLVSVSREVTTTVLLRVLDEEVAEVVNPQILFGPPIYKLQSAPLSKRCDFC